MKIWLDTSTGERGFAENLVVFDVTPSDYFDSANMLFDILDNVSTAMRYDLAWVFGKAIVD